MGFGSFEDLTRLEGRDPASQMIGPNSAKGNPPEAPNYSQLARIQGDENRDTARLQSALNNPNEVNAFGSRTFTRGPGGRQTVTTNLSPELQGLLDRSNENYATEFDMSGLPGAPDLNNTQSRDAMVNALVNRQQPFMDRTRSRREAQLANQGIMQGSEAYKSAQDDLARSENDFYLGAQQQAGDEQSREFDLMNRARGNALSESLTQRNLPLSELQALMGMRDPLGGGVSGSQINPGDFYGAGQDQYAATMGRYNSQMANQSNMMTGLFSLGAAALSDRRAKTDIKVIGKLPSGLNWHQFKYIGSDETQEGVMSDEVRELFPDAVVVGEDGLDRVYYSRIH